MSGSPDPKAQPLSASADTPVPARSVSITGQFEAKTDADSVGHGMRSASMLGKFEPGGLDALPPPPSVGFSAARSGDADDRLPQIENYEVLEKIAQGAMGIVYKARHRKL